MAVAADRYSRLVAWLKIVLPLLALAILSTLFLVSRTIDPSQSIPYAEVDVEDLARTQRVGAPAYSGMTEDGAAVSFNAVSVRPGGEGGRVAAEAPVARIELPTGRVLELSAKAGYVDQKAEIVSLQGEVHLETSDGYRVDTEAAEARLDATSMETAGPVTGTGPMGDVSAGRARLVHQPDGGYVLRFEKGVNLLYRPAS